MHLWVAFLLNKSMNWRLELHGSGLHFWPIYAGKGRWDFIFKIPATI
ncbi:hypothetical protein Pint_20632 [Pistacia integerrima]|uniref:Uncharacterized protein n=1 Tax=Pistacia integerrima TaxID=434235 RepID=A0ACC0X9A4_9ROSI|nr:hypothetical protein Pint_20632 [Pistacia integerrima]